MIVLREFNGAFAFTARDGRRVPLGKHGPLFFNSRAAAVASAKLHGLRVDRRGRVSVDKGARVAA